MSKYRSEAGARSNGCFGVFGLPSSCPLYTNSKSFKWEREESEAREFHGTNCGGGSDYCLSDPILHILGKPTLFRSMLWELRFLQLHLMSRLQTKWGLLAQKIIACLIPSHMFVVLPNIPLCALRIKIGSAAFHVQTAEKIARIPAFGQQIRKCQSAFLPYLVGC